MHPAPVIDINISKKNMDNILFFMQNLLTALPNLETSATFAF